MPSPFQLKKGFREMKCLLEIACSFAESQGQAPISGQSSGPSAWAASA